MTLFSAYAGLGFCRMVSQEYGLSEKVLNVLAQFIGGSTSEIQVI